MGLQVSLGFNGKAQEALEFYQKIFGFSMPQIMRYSDMRADPAYPADEETGRLIMYASFEIMGVTVMVSDCPPGMAFAYGKNVGLAIVSKNPEEIKKFYEALKEDGVVEMELQKTFWSEAYGILTDKFGISWQLNQDCQ